MGKKEKNKARLDKFYHMAKEHGYRSRAAFKLIQLNKKYDFLSTCKCLVDLCAAPGGWLQVASKYMPIASIKIGVDLAAIRPIKGCVSFQEDITTPRCVQLIKRELKHFKADVVLNDGAPNVGAEWTKDAYNQAELSLHALKVATEVLRKGGMFITKVFRSKDYNSLLFVLNHLFNKVEATKPQASRSQSAEIFVVCQGFKAPDTIDPKFLDPKFAFEEVEDEQDSNKQITSLKKLLEKKVNRGGYGDRTSLYQETDLYEFLQCEDPYLFLSSYNKFKIDEKSKEIFNTIAPPKELEVICEDVKVCGRGELFSLLKFRHKYQKQQEGEKKKLKQEQDKLLNNSKEKGEDELEEENDKELDETIKRVQRERKRQDKKDRLRKAKTELRAKMSVIASTDMHNTNDEVLFDRKTYEKLQKLDIDELIYDHSSDDDVNVNMDVDNEKIRPQRPKVDKKKQQQEQSDSDEDEDDDIKRVDQMADEIDEYYQQRKEYKMELDRKLVKKERKKKALIEQQRLKKEDEQEEEELNNDDIREKRVKFTEDVEDNEDDDEDMLDDGEGSDDGGYFLNPLLMNDKQQKKKKPKKDGNSSDVSEGEWSSADEADEANKKKSEKGTKKDKDLKLGKRKKREEDDDVVDFFANKEIEEVPQEKLEEGYSSMDSDDMAETRALAKVMLRKKARNEVLDSTYNKFSTFDDPSLLPDWFQEDERKHFKPNIHVTKEMVAEEKKILKAYNERPSKKVMEAKQRKKRRLAKAMNKIKQKAQVIAEQDINEGTKMRQINKLYKKEKAKMVEEKKYIVSKNFNSIGRKSKIPRGTKVVDKRMKKDTKMQKQRDKKMKKNGGRRKK